MKVTCSDVSAVLGRRTVLSGISLEVPTGSLTAIVGPNGSGKSTLLRVLYRAVRPTRGSAVIGETDVWRAGPRTAARLRAVVPQHQPSQSGLRVREVVELGRYAHLRWFDRTRRDDRKAVDQALSRVGITGLAERPIGALSGGERQRVLLARALVQQAPVLLLDEPTEHLDRDAAAPLLRGLLTPDGLFGADRTVVVATHHLDDDRALECTRLVITAAPQAAPDYSENSRTSRS